MAFTIPAFSVLEGKDIVIISDGEKSQPQLFDSFHYFPVEVGFYIGKK